MTEENNEQVAEEQPQQQQNDGLTELRKVLFQHQQNRAALEGSLASIAGKNFDRKDIVKLQIKFKDFLAEVDDFVLSLVQDLYIVTHQLSQLRDNQFTTENRVLTLMTALKDNGTVTTDQLTTAWKETVRPQIEEQFKKAQEQSQQATEVPAEQVSEEETSLPGDLFAEELPEVKPETPQTD